MSEPDLDLEDMLLLCGEPEVDHSIAPAAQLRALIDGLITQRARAEAAEATIERLRAALEATDENIVRVAKILAYEEWPLATEAERRAWTDKHWFKWGRQAKAVLAALQSTEQRT